MDDGDFRFDLFDSHQTQHAWDVLARMRRECPVAEPTDGFHYTARFKDTERVFRDSRTFSCEGGFRAAGVVIPDDEQLMSEMDPPRHPTLRKFLLTFFNPGMAKESEAFTRSYVDSLLAAVDDQGGGDLVAEVATRIPLAVTGHVLGVPLEDIPELSRRFFELLHTDWPAYGLRDRSKPDEGHDIAGSAPELTAYLDQMIDDRRSGRVRNDDLMSKLVEIEVQGAPLTVARIRSLSVNFLSAGLSTTNLISNLLYRLITSPDFDRALRDDATLIPVAVEESLRFEPPVLFMFRTVKEATSIADKELVPGDRVVPGIASANRDETIFESANEFRLRRDDPDHLAFGGGPHLCLGNHMARMEGRVAVELYLSRFQPGVVALAPDYEYELMPHYLEYGPDHLEVVVSR